MLNRKAKVDRQFIEVGDFILPDGFAIERKTGRDFVSSISDKRLYTQLNNLCQYDRPILAIVSDNIWRDFYFSKSSYIHNTFRGCLTTITAKYPKVRLIQFECDEDFVDYIIELEDKVQKEGKGIRPAPMQRRATTPQQTKENILASIKGVGIAMAKKLLHRYTSVNQVANADVKDMIKIEKLGNKVAERIKEMLN